MKNRIEAALKEAVEAGAAPGIVAAAVGPDGAPYTAAIGVRSLADATPMSADTVFWIASLTKAVTSVAALQLVERGLVGLDEPIGGKLPALASPRVLTGFDAEGRAQTRPAATPITLRHLLTHTSGLAYDFTSEALIRAKAGAQAGFGETPDIPLLFEPGSDWIYGIGIDWAGQLVQTLTGEPLEAYMAQNILRPLGMDDTAFFPNEGQGARKAGVHARLPDGGLAPIDFGMPPAPYFGMGGGGLYSTAGDYLRFLRAMLGGGALDGTRILTPQSMALLTSDQSGGRDAGVLKSAQPHMSNDFDPFPGMANRWSCGFLINTGPGPNGRAAGSLAWGGLANCYYWADPTSGAAGVFLSQVLPFADPRLLGAFAAFERAVYDA